MNHEAEALRLIRELDDLTKEKSQETIMTGALVYATLHLAAAVHELNDKTAWPAP